MSVREFFMEVTRNFQTTLADRTFWVGLIAVLIFSFTRFNERQIDEEELDPPIQIASFTTRFRFKLAMLSYGGVWLVIYGVLIVLGGIPSVSEILKQWIGVAQGATGDEAKIGTPAWASLAVTAILPGLPYVRGADERLRSFLRDFASIPTKVRRTADELVAGVRSLVKEASVGQNLVSSYELLQQFVERLRDTQQRRFGRTYSDFFARNRTVLENLNRRFEEIAGDRLKANGSIDQSAPLLEALSKRIARFVVCAVLSVEPDEVRAYNVLSNTLAVPGISAPRFRFTASQIWLGIAVVVLAVVVGYIAANIGVLVYFRVADGGNQYIPQTSLDLQIIGILVKAGSVIGILAIPMFIMPLVFGAAVQMYLLDRAQFGSRLEWHEKAVAWVLTFLGTYGLALLPALVIAAIGTALQEKSEVRIDRWWPWAVSPAAVATLFVILSSRAISTNRLVTIVVDFVSHGAIASIGMLLAIAIAGAAGFDFGDGSTIEFGRVTGPLQVFGLLGAQYFSPVAVITSFIAGGTVGAIQCNISRQASQPDLRQISPANAQLAAAPA